jgi:hypothetical protein
MDRWTIEERWGFGHRLCLTPGLADNTYHRELLDEIAQEGFGSMKLS